MKARHFGSPRCSQLFLAEHGIGENQVDFPFEFHSLRQMLTTDEHIQRQGLLILQQKITALVHAFHPCNMDTHLSGIVLRNEKASRRHQVVGWQMQHKVFLIVQAVEKRFVDHHVARHQSISIGAPHINGQQLLTDRHKTIHQQIALCMMQHGVLSQCFAHETRTTCDDCFCTAQAFTHSLHQGSSYRIAQQEATRQHSRHQNDSGGNQTVESSIVLLAL